jgi:rod shape-determining protein MreC
MEEIILLFTRYRAFLFFVILETIFVSVYIDSHDYPRAAINDLFSETSAELQNKRSKLEDYLVLDTINNILMTENADLLEKITFSYYQKQALLAGMSTDTVLQNIASVFNYTPARVVSHTYTKRTNWLVLDKGENHGIYEEMGVVTQKALVGVVVKTTSNFSLVRTILDASNYPFSPFVRLKNSGHLNKIIWEQDSPNVVVLKNVPNHLVVSQGEIVLSSEESIFFPEGIQIGTVKRTVTDLSNNMQKVYIALDENFQDLRYVYILENKAKPEITQLEESIQKMSAYE